MTSAVNPSLEDIVTQAIPGMPKVIVHNPVLAYENGDEFMQAWYDAEAGKLDPFVLVVEGSIPNEELSGDGYWAAMGTDPSTGQPITTNEWVDRLAPKAAAVVALGTCATYGGIPAMKNNPTGAMGVPDYLGWDWKSSAACRWSASQAARPSRTTPPRPFSTCRYTSPGGPRCRSWTRRCGRNGCSGEPCERTATGPGSPRAATSQPSTATTTAAW